MQALDPLQETGGLKMGILLQARPAPPAVWWVAVALWDDHPHQNLKALGGLVGLSGTERSLC